MAISWTEKMATWTPGSTGWQNYDIYTAQSVPKGAIAYILMQNGQDAATATLGVRADGSSLNRYILLHEAEGGLGTTATMYVKVDSSTGYIETYCDTTTSIVFFLLGYWTGTDFTEKADSMSTGGATVTWNAIDVYTSYSVPKGSVCQVLVGNRLDGSNAILGVRAGGSSLARYRDVHEAESATAETTDHECYSMCAKSNSSTGNIEIYYATATSTFMLLGYFQASTMDYVECAPTNIPIASSSTWVDYDGDTSLGSDWASKVWEIICGHAVTNSEVLVGARAYGSSLNRYAYVHEAETNGEVGATFPTASDSSNLVQVYSSNSATEHFDVVGYHLDYVEPPAGFAYCFGTVMG